MTISLSPGPGIYRRFVPQPSARPAIFLDRDGVIVEDTGYLHRPADIRFIPGSLEAILSFNHAGTPVVVVTNQAGIGRGYYEWKDFEAVQTAIEDELRAIGAWLDGVWACAYHPEHPFRKPNPGMLLDAARCMNVRLEQSWLAGDKWIDVEAAARAGLRGAVLVRTGYGGSFEKQASEARWNTQFHTAIADSLAAAVPMLIQCHGL